ncbi:hypothetical protein ABZ820_06315 [Streptomyces diacarni]|uniref:hypothetical protein n=1 Tax=Streptomyces diacarni TaxID=2800381 RepID=UPI0033CF49BD
MDETSFDFRALDTDQLADLLDDFNDTLAEILRTRVVAAAEWWHEQGCLDDCELGDFLWSRDGPGSAVSPDTRRRMTMLMDRCPTWEADGDTDVPETVTVAGRTRELAYTVGHALCRTRSGRTMACLVFSADSAPSGWQRVHSVVGEAELYFLEAASGLPEFLRGVYERELVPQEAFPAMATEAFPRLVLASSLSFGRFKGGYHEVYDWVVHVLTVVNDHFAAAMSEHKGMSNEVADALQRLGVNASPESPNTHANKRAMRQREVVHDEDGETYRCEWHAKRHPLHDRIHFSLPEQRLGGRVLIGIFVDHLDT